MIMKIATVLIAAGLASLTPDPGAAPTKFDLAFATYLGGNSFDAARGICVDSAGNIIVVGGTSSTDFPTTEGAFCRHLTPAGPDVGRLGATDVFVAKFSPKGELLWSTYLGGPNYDRAYSVDVDSHNRIFISGRAGPGFPTTKGSFQPDYVDTFAQGSDVTRAEYGRQNGFVACMDSEGHLVWSSYVLSTQLCRDITVDDAGDVYLVTTWNGNGPAPAPFAAGFRKASNLPGGSANKNQSGDTCVIKVKGDGSRILWGGWLGGSGQQQGECMVRVNGAHEVYLLCTTTSTDLPFNPEDHGDHHFHGGPHDLYLAKVSADGEHLLYGTYLGGKGQELTDTHNLAIDKEGNAYVMTSTDSPDLPVSPGAFQPALGGKSNAGLYKVGPDGRLLACTYLGGSQNQKVEGIAVSSNGNVYVTGTTIAIDFPVAGEPFQTAGSPPVPFDKDSVVTVSGYFSVMSNDFKKLIYSTYIGKGASIRGNTAFVNAFGGPHVCAVAPDGSLVAAGSWLTDGLPVKNAYQKNFVGGPMPTQLGDPNYTKHCDAAIVRFVPSSASGESHRPSSHNEPTASHP